MQPTTTTFDRLRRAGAIVIAIALLASMVGCFGSDDDGNQGADDDASAGSSFVWPTPARTLPPLLRTPTPTPTPAEQILATIRARGLTGEYVETETLSFIEQVAEDPGEAAETLAIGVATLLLIVFDEDVPFEHKVEVLGETFVPFWGCVRPAVGGSLFDPDDIDFSRMDLDSCADEAMQTFLLGAAGYMAGRIVTRADNLYGFKITAQEAEEVVERSAELYGWTSSIYDQGISRRIPLAAQTNQFLQPGLYQRFAHPSNFDGTTGLPADFDVERFLEQTRQFRTRDFTIPNSLMAASSNDG